MALLCKITILVVEDEILVRMLGTDMLETAGFVVREAGNADEAIAILSAENDIALLFSDIDMPGNMDGLGLAKFVHIRRPDIRLLLTSGRQTLSPEQLPMAGQFMPKPWTESALIGKVNGLLAARPHFAPERRGRIAR